MEYATRNHDWTLDTLTHTRSNVDSGNDDVNSASDGNRHTSSCRAVGGHCLVTASRLLEPSGAAVLLPFFEQLCRKALLVEPRRQGIEDPEEPCYQHPRCNNWQQGNDNPKHHNPTTLPLVARMHATSMMSRTAPRARHTHWESHASVHVAPQATQGSPSHECKLCSRQPVPITCCPASCRMPAGGPSTTAPSCR